MDYDLDDDTNKDVYINVRRCMTTSTIMSCRWSSTLVNRNVNNDITVNDSINDDVMVSMMMWMMTSIFHWTLQPLNILPSNLMKHHP